jgi:hypothetical protein
MPVEKKMRKTGSLIPPVQDGQVWQMIDSRLCIELVGKRLVHYKHYNPKIKRPNVLLSSKATLERFLQKSGAILLPETPSLPGAGRSPTQPRRKPNRKPAAGGESKRT